MFTPLHNCLLDNRPPFGLRLSIHSEFYCFPETAFAHASFISALSLPCSCVEVNFVILRMKYLPQSDEHRNRHECETSRQPQEKLQLQVLVQHPQQEHKADEEEALVNEPWRGVPFRQDVGEHLSSHQQHRHHCQYQRENPVLVVQGKAQTHKDEQEQVGGDSLSYAQDERRDRALSSVLSLS